ncbi:hypothetical protein D9Q98_001642 [Chlorella vulgaris]|uniref:Plant synaptotagmin n=1 Tax=Chlorella vulgaris TaxID=3077 RepID=A0A9D4TW46_CHLVU|nr:hypothetical protein D9Q98_001642 [Chlorella vulgaris]
MAALPPAVSHPANEQLQELASALDRHMQQHGTAGPFLLGCLVTLACIAIGVLSWRRLERQREGLEAAAHMAEASDAELRRLLKDALPSWVMVPDSARVEWLNAVTAQVWPFVERAAVKFLMKDKLLDSLLNSTTFWRPRVLANAELHVVAMSLGQEPPRVTGVKTFPRQAGLHNEVLQEYSFVWSSKMDVKLLVKLLGKRSGGGAQSLLAKVVRLKVGVANLVARGTLRIALKPLLDEIPIIGGVKVSFMGCPDFSYSTRVLGGNPYIVPGIKHLIDSFIKDTLLRPFNYPDGFTYDLVTRSVSEVPERPQGLLEVTIVQATSVPRMDTFGTCDPYCLAWVRETRKLRTGVKSRTLKPSWKETFTFMVHSTQHQDLNLALYDADFWSEDDLIGSVKVALSSLDLTPGVVNELWLPITRAGEQPSNGDDEGADERIHRVRGLGGGAAAADEQDLTSFTPAASGLQLPPGSPQQSRDVTGPTLLDPPHALSPLPAAFSANAPAALPGSLQPMRSSLRSGPQQLEARSTASSGLGTVWSQQLRQLASNPLTAFNRKCMLHITASYFPLTDQEIAAVARETGKQQRGEADHTRTGADGSLANVPRVANMLRSGILYVWLERANNLQTKKAGFTRNMKISVRVNQTRKTTETGNMKLQQRANPVFEEMIELIVDSATAQRSNAMIHIDIFTEHFLRRPSFQGRVSIPLKDVIERQRIRDTWPLQDVEQGDVTMELSWLSALSM